MPLGKGMPTFFLVGVTHGEKAVFELDPLEVSLDHTVNIMTTNL